MSHIINKVQFIWFSFINHLLKHKTPYIILFLFSLICHSYYGYELFVHGTLFTGKGDGISQMIPFQLFLYEKFSNFSMFYAQDFGIGGDYFSDLAYYYSTNLIFYLNCIIVFILDIFFPLPVDRPEFWLYNAWFISVIKLTIIFFITYHYAKLWTNKNHIAYVFSILYGFSSVYFLFTFTWSFFSDVMIYLPLTLLGLERILRYKKPGLFIIAIAATLFNNFYFAYYEFVIVLLYFLFRLIFRYKDDIASRGQYFTQSVIGAIIGLFISSIGLLAGVTSFLDNGRGDVDVELKLLIPLMIHYNVFYDGHYLILFFLVIPALFSFKLYRHFAYKMFAIFTILFLVLSLSEYTDSFFNGFSAVQRRWVYILAFFAAGLIAQWIYRIRELNLSQFIHAMIPVFIIYPIAFIEHDKVLIWTISIPVLFILGLFTIKNEHINLKWYSYITIISSIVMIYGYYQIQIKSLHPVEERNIAHIQSEKYNSAYQNKMIENIKDNIKPYERINWLTYLTHNTPMYQHFNGVSLYSSIFHKDILRFYDELMVSMGTNSHSIYYGLANRTNLYSLMNVAYSVEKGEKFPTHFELDKSVIPNNINTNEPLNPVKNTKLLPYVRTTDNIYSKDGLQFAIDKEHAMLDGVVANDQGEAFNSHSENLLSSATLQYNNSKMTEEGLLHVTKDDGGIILNLPKGTMKKYDDMYVTFYGKLTDNETNYHHYWVNENYETRKPLNDDYRRELGDRVIAAKANDQISIRMKAGKYHFKVKGIHGEDYSQLDRAISQSEDHKVNLNGRNITINLNNPKGKYAVMPLPYRDGMKAKVDGETKEIIDANYHSAIAIPIDSDSKEIVITYKPPYWMIGIIGTILGIIGFVGYLLFINKNKLRHRNEQNLFKKFKSKKRQKKAKHQNNSGDQNDKVVV